MKELEEKLIHLILERCLNFNQAKLLHIQVFLREHLYFAKKVEEEAKKYGVEVIISLNDLHEIHDYLKETALEDIKLNPLISRANWDYCSKKGGALLFLNTAVPGLMEDIESDKLVKMQKLKETTNPYYRANVSKYAFPWCIIDLPNEAWAKEIFPNDEKAYEKLYLKIMEMCMITEPNPLESWNQWIMKSNQYKKRLNELQITKLHYQNSLGTDLYVTKRPDAIWLNLDKTDLKGGKMIANMPSYEIFTSPDFRGTEGIVYSSRPLLYQGQLIEDFWLRFHQGKVVEFDAKKNREALKNLLEQFKNSYYLGEIALVENDSPISNTGIVFKTTLFDENASCHFALGQAYTLPIQGADQMTEEELLEVGLNHSDVHVDFMIGTPDLEIEAETIMGRKLIFHQGKFNI